MKGVDNDDGTTANLSQEQCAPIICEAISIGLSGHDYTRGRHKSGNHTSLMRESQENKAHR